MQKIDLHVHSNYSFDCHETMENQIKGEIDRGVSVMCFCDHLEHNRLCDTFSTFDFARREQEFFALKEKYKGQIKVLLGFEIGEPDRHPEVYKALEGRHCDMLIGSCHYALDKYFWLHEGDNPHEICRDYNDDVKVIVNFGHFDVLGHADMPKRYFFGDDYFEDEQAIKENMRLCVLRGIIPEMNCSPFKKGIDEPSPSYKYLDFYAECGGKYVTVSSDSHQREFCAQHFEEAVSHLNPKLKLCYFENRKLVELV